MMNELSEYDSRVQRLKDLYSAGHIYREQAKAGPLAWTERQLVDHALEDFNDDFRFLEEVIREDVRDEEMEIAQSDNYELQQDIRQLEFQLKQERYNQTVVIQNALKKILDECWVEEPANTSDGEEWAFNDGANSVVEKVRKTLDDLRDNP